MLQSMSKEVESFKKKEMMGLEEMKNNVEKLNEIQLALDSAITELEVYTRAHIHTHTHTQTPTHTTHSHPPTPHTHTTTHCVCLLINTYTVFQYHTVTPQTALFSVEKGGGRLCGPCW